MINIDRICSELNLEKDKIINIYRYGSIVYGTNNENSDEDFIIVYKWENLKVDSVKNASGTINATIYSLAGFKDRMYYQEISVLECLWIDPEDKYETIDLSNLYKLDLINIRKAVSEKCSNSFVKAKKKLLLGETYIGQKSMFHSIRIFNFAIQIVEHGKIIDYKTGNLELYNKCLEFTEWNKMKKYFYPIFKRKHKKFKELTIK